jgi:V8-like Glu-specific endopeptidase
MQLRMLTTASVLALSLAMAAGVAAAAETAGNKGPATATTRAAPEAIWTFTPMEPPRVDPANVSRGPLELDPAKALASMGTVTLAKDGKVSEAPASEGMRAILEGSVKGSNPDQTTSRAVIGPDDRKQITDSSEWPYRVVGLWLAKNQKGEVHSCSATLIGPFSVITAAHCVYDHDADGWIADGVFIPGAVDAENAPFGTFGWANINILKGFIDNYQDNYGDVMPWDLAEIELDGDAGNQLGWIGFRADDATDFHATMIGYPGDKPDGTMWTTSCDIPAANFDENNFIHTCDMTPGSSGSSMFEDLNGETYIRGINIAEDNDQVPADQRVNYGLRLNDSYFQFMMDYYK